MMTTRKTFCSICTAFCGFEAEIEAGRVVSMKPDKTHPMSQGFSCSKGRNYHQLLNAEDRATRCRHRAGSAWQTLDKDDALDRIASSLRGIIAKHGPESVAFYCGNGVTVKALAMPSVHAFMQGLGSHQVYSSLTIDQPAKILSTGRHGLWAAGVHSFDSANVVMLIGNNVFVSGLQGGPGGVPGWRPGEVRKARKRGLKLIVIDPRFTETAQQSDIYLPIKPGMDAVLLSGMINYLLRQGLEDSDFCEHHTEGLEQLVREVAPYDLATTAELTGLEQSLIQEAIELFVREGRGTVSSCTGPDMAPHGNLTEHLINSLNSLCGRYNRAGDRVNGSLLTPDMPPMAAVIPWEFMPPKLSLHANDRRSRVRGAHQLYGEMPTATLAEEILTPGPGQIRALFVLGGNPVLSVPDQAQITRALENLDLRVCIDARMSETAELADYFLPSTYGLERVDMTVFNDPFWGQPFHQVAQPVVEAPGDAADEYQYLAALASRLGVAMNYPGGIIDTADPPAPMELLELLFPPGSTRVSPREIAAVPEGRVFEQYKELEVLLPMEGMEARLRFMPQGVAEEFACLRDSLAAPEPSGDYLLICRRHPHVYNSMCHTFPKAPPENVLWANPDDMQEAALDRGQPVLLQSRHGEVKATLQEDHTLRRGVVAMTHGFGGKTGGVSVNRLLSTEDTTDRHTFIPRMSAVPVKLRKLAG